jgi:hypothetical protein
MKNRNLLCLNYVSVCLKSKLSQIKSLDFAKLELWKSTNYRMKDQQQAESSIDSFFDLTDEEISKLAKEATRAAVEDLHDLGISTCGMRDSIMYETKPNGEKVQNARISTTS